MPKSMNVEYLLGKLTESSFNAEVLQWSYLHDPRYQHQFPIFSINTVPTMLRDPRIRYGLGLIKGPITTYTKFFNSEEAESPDIHTAIVELNYHFPYSVTCKEGGVEQENFIIEQLTRFWEVGLVKALTAIEWGYSASEVQYKKDSEGRIIFDNLRLIHPLGLQAVTRQRGLIGFMRGDTTKGYVPLGKGLWHIHGREYHPFYGQSRLLGAHVPWHETWMLGGARDIRRTWYFKNAYDGGELYYPEGSFVDENGNKTSFEDYALKMLGLKRSGSTMLFPSDRDMQGKRKWEYEKPSAPIAPQGLETYIQTLRDEELEGLGIPPEVVQSAGNDGMGSATGRLVPLMVYLASLSPLGSDVLNDFCTQVLPVILKANDMPEDFKLKRVVPKTPPSGSATPVQEKTVQDTGLAS